MILGGITYLVATDQLEPYRTLVRPDDEED